MAALSSTAAATSTLPLASSFADSGSCSRLSTTTLSGWRVVSTSRTFNCGSSSLTVPMPLSTAQARARQAWPSRRASGPVIHWLWPLASAVLPSRLAAIFMRTQGRPRLMRATKPMFSACASFCISPDSTSIPAARRRA